MLGFLDSLRARGAAVVVDSLALSPEGRLVPWVVASYPRVAGPADARRTGKPIVYLKANIHGGVGVLAGYLLEPASEDGVATWDLLAPEPAGGESPVLRSRAPVHAPADPLP